MRHGYGEAVEDLDRFPKCAGQLWGMEFINGQT